MKNKLDHPFRKAEFDIIYGKGISWEGDILDLAVEEDLILKSGSWYVLGEERIGQGRANARRYLTENKESAAKIEATLRERLGLTAEPAAGEETA